MVFENLTQMLVLQAAHPVMNGVRAVAQGLVGLGFAPGDRAAVVGEAGTDWAIATFGVVASGGVAVHMGATPTADEAARVIASSGATVAFVGDVSGAEALLVRRAAVPALGRIVLLRGEYDHPLVLSRAGLEALGPSGGLSGMLMRQEDAAMWLYAAGERQAVLTQGDLIAHVESGWLSTLAPDEAVYPRSLRVEESGETRPIARAPAPPGLFSGWQRRILDIYHRALIAAFDDHPTA